MKRTVSILAGGLLLGALTTGAFADDGRELVIEGETISTTAIPAENSPLDELISGWRFRSAETQALQMDDFENPAFVAIEYAEEIWETPAGTSGKSCESCHGDANSFEGLRTKLPRWDEKMGKPATMEMLINASIEEHQGAKPWKWESEEMLAMTSLIGLQSRGMPVALETEGPIADWITKGEKLYYTRVGQLDMACASCHEDNYGNMIRADHLSQGQINGFPVYRLKWGGLGSIHRRFKGCMKQVRAEPYKPGGDEFIALEAYVATRGMGLSVETPSIRN
ncbi:sulfur oxidation c-type cytochrome SoxA [Pseudovibrio sp. Tun.PSC04-5.I4]|uniref:sulfur oxidation c-type cytochrome SoxA n=1 Tax=Pseudovibrio sp. Tun.PSC04-5.I4 TaxID=1798213 RepID=UPI000880F466|nr:sulfur oxidation c-type cytochrome SoxA [Pseudovibrio sp. Tun.PSC04-5.I4]SDQ75882.1 sulfur-oxidizing protein SoxA [Pseudovibrio sp. Tun.PSC04-5.I4]